MNQDELKLKVAKAAIAYVEEDAIVGVGTGSTVNYFIDELAKIKHTIQGTVASSKASEEKLKALGIPVFELTSVSSVPVYIDGADAVDKNLNLTKGGGGALTREKIIAAAANKFICMIDESKQVGVLGEFPIAVEVIPMARSYVARKIVVMGGDPAYREGFVTDNGNIILDVYNLKLTNPIEVEQKIKAITGVVDNGLFAVHKPKVVLVSKASGVVESLT